MSKEKVTKNFYDSLNTLVREIKENQTSKDVVDLIEFTEDFVKENVSLMYCYEYITEDMHDQAIEHVERIKKHVLGKRGSSYSVTEPTDTEAWS